MKKILILLLCFQLLILPALAEYDFSDEAQAEFDRNKFQPVISQPIKDNFSKKRQQIQNTNTPQILEEEVINNTYQPKPKILFGNVTEIPTGTSFLVSFDSGINSGSLEKNDRLIAKLTQDFVYNGTLIAPKGSLVYGNAINAKNAGYAYGSGVLEISFNQIMTPDGNMIDISTEKIYMEAKNERAKKMTRDVLIGAVGSILIGAAFTALGGGDDWGRNMLIYGGLGAAGGGIRGALQRGEDVDIPNGTTIELRLNQPLNVSPYESY